MPLVKSSSDFQMFTIDLAHSILSLSTASHQQILLVLTPIKPYPESNHFHLNHHHLLPKLPQQFLLLLIYCIYHTTHLPYNHRGSCPSYGQSPSGSQVTQEWNPRSTQWLTRPYTIAYYPSNLFSYYSPPCSFFSLATSLVFSSIKSGSFLAQAFSTSHSLYLDALSSNTLGLDCYIRVLCSNVTLSQVLP